MNRIKDFFYNKNDVLVALIILAAAAFIIYMRIDDIMSYPDTLVKTSVADQSSIETTLPASASSETAAAASGTSKPVALSGDYKAVSKQLAKEGVISSAKEFEDALKKYDMTGRIRSGTFEIPAGATSEQIIEIITGEKLNPSAIQ